MAAIVSADVVGFSRLMGVDEIGTLERLKALHKDLVRPYIVEHGGWIVKLMGDGLLAEFPSVVESVQCAVEIQQSLASREPNLPDTERIRLRIGVNPGDIIIAGSDIYGDGVNIAARLEILAVPGAICISGKVYEEVRDRLKIPFEDMGRQDVKNIARPVQVWQWIAQGQAASNGTASATGIIVPVLPSDKPVIAVLPFDNMSGDPEQDYFSNGMAVDLAIDLAKHPGLKLLSRNASFGMRQSASHQLDSIRGMGVSHLVEGSVRKMGQKIRVSVELTEALEGESPWAERYDGKFSEIFNFQDTIRSQIVVALNFNLLGDGTIGQSSRGTENTDAYDLYMKGRERYFHYTPDGLKDAIELLKAAIELDPNFADAHAYLAYFYTAVRTLRFIAMDDPLGLAKQSAMRAVELAPESALANTWFGWVYGLRGEHEIAYQYFEKAISIDPELPEVFAYYGSTCIYGGRPEKALALSERALGLLSFAPPSWEFHVGQAHFYLRDYNRAIQKYEQARQRIPQFTSLRIHMAAAYWEAGRLDEARDEIAAVMDIAPDYALSTAADNYPYVEGEVRDRFLNALKSAGLKN